MHSVLTSVIALITAFFATFGQFTAPFTQVIKAGGMNKLFEDWSAEDEFTRDYCTELEKDPDKDFVVLNIADIQMMGLEPFNETGALAECTISKLIEETDPDLITLSGDNAWDTEAYIDMVNLIDSYGIPWAPVMGNHDGENTVGEWWCALQYLQTENCLFKLGPADMGYGNYIINITENGDIIHTIFMMDTHSNALNAGSINGFGGYDHLWSNQMEWYKWAVEGIEKVAGHPVESSVVIHIPTYECTEIKSTNYDPDTDTFTGEYAEGSFGKFHEDVCCANKNNGFVNLCSELGSTKNIIFGHDHVNCASFIYDGIRLTYSLKCGSGCYWEKEMNGGTTLTISSDGAATAEHHYIEPMLF